MVKNNIGSFLSHWMDGLGPYPEVVISSRIRLARNIKGLPFPYFASDSQKQKVQQSISEVLENCGESNGLSLIKMEDLDPLVKEVMMEKHLISPLLTQDDHKCAVCLSKEEETSIMINEEDHLRIQSFLPGLQLEKAWEEADYYDNIVERNLEYSFHERYGYLTSCPTNVGTGLRASIMLHLPGLIITKQLNQVLSALSQIGLAVRGLYGEGAEVVGNLVQISNQITLGQSEEEIIQNLYNVTKQVIEQENTARQFLLNKNREKIEDRSRRALGVLKYAYLISWQEAMQLISDVRMGFEMGFISGIDRRMLNELLIIIRPACLQMVAGQELEVNERDLERAKQVRKKLKNVSM